MSVFFPSIEPFKIHKIAVDEEHKLYVEESGNPRGLPFIVLHGGPGSGSNENFRRIFDPKIYRIILYDQRGAGRSTPKGELKDNTTDKLVQDLEVIRVQLDIKKWFLFGESWGSSLALVYSILHPSRVMGLILRGALLAREADVTWFYKPGGVNRIFPDAWEKLLHPLTQEERRDVLKSYYNRLMSDSQNIRSNAAKSFSLYGKTCSHLLQKPEEAQNLKDDEKDLINSALIEAHYYVNHFFLEPQLILKHIERIDSIHTILIHGRYDMCATLDNAYILHKSLPNSTLKIVPDAGHSVIESGYHPILIEATNEFLERS